MAASLSSFSATTLTRKPYLKVKNRGSLLQTKAQSFRDEGRQTNMVDANLSVLKERMEVVKVKEKLERCCKFEYGWNYGAVYDDHNYYKLKVKKREMLLSNLVELAGPTYGTNDWHMA
ncbi:TGF-beta-activated kinase 1 and MAP3K7-binding protein like [Quillaja saponaria]|uniref:TGF-beta-activated kinase 1 and MAP3K7-binding protein like n=1 Tax=Quillaja saponaria TaxID=32244 RepID=A0AAD7Q6K3_QUISA|nr:TGF-beta-activated kinase 1 and MAP3K7-binding protein like [Quillaja saponaria]